MATFRKRSSKWHVQVRRAGHPTLTRSFTHKSDADAWARKIERQIDSGDLTVDQRALKGLTVRDLLVRYQETITPSKRGARMERYKIATLLTHPISDCPLRVLTAGMVICYRDDRLQQVKSGTVRRELNVLQHCLEVARREWNIPILTNPVGQITLPPASKSRNHRPTPEDLGKLIKGCRLGRTPLLAPVIIIAIETGMRRGEIVSMRWEDLDLEAGTLHIPVTKNGHSRTIPLTSRATTLLQDLPRNDERVFPLSGNAIRLAWERLKKRVGVVDLRFHDLRHEAISRFFEMGLSVPEVALISGHKDPRMLFPFPSTSQQASWRSKRDQADRIRLCISRSFRNLV